MAEEKTSQRGSNLSREDRERGGRASAAKQVRDARGQFAGRRDGGSNKPGREQSREQTNIDQQQQVNRNQNQDQDMDQNQEGSQGG
jgi:hypothetical protein